MTKQKVVVVGTGMVGASYAYSLVNQGIVNELVLIDLNEKSAIANAEDIKHATCFLPKQPKIYAGTYADCKDADVVCVTAGAAQKPGQTRLDLVKINAKIITGITKEIMASGFNGILLLASNPVDIMTMVARQVSGLPKERVFGSGTTLDSGRLRNNLSEYFECNPTNVHAYIVGEHGDSSLPLWSTATIGQKPIVEIVEESNGKYSMEDLNNLYVEARDAAYKIIEGKGATYFGIGVSLARITKAIFSNQGSILTCGVHLEGEYGLEDVCIPVPAMIGEEGIQQVQELRIDEKELELLTKSANTLKDIFAELEL